MILDFSNVVKSYGALRALDGISFAVDRNEIVAVLGPNGAGKTTAIEIALGLRSATRGSVRLFGRSPRSIAVRRRVGVTPQESGFPDLLRVEELIAFVAEHYPHPASVAKTLADFGLTHLAAKRAGALSGGESRRLAVALAFTGNPEFVVLDEPTVGLDVESRRRLWDFVRSAGGDRSILFSTHYLEEAEALATRIIVIDRGRLLFDGGARALRERFGRRRLTYVGAPLDSAQAGLEVSLTEIDGRVVVIADDTDAYVRALVREGVAFRDLEVERPSLEEAFLSITGGAR